VSRLLSPNLVVRLQFVAYENVSLDANVRMEHEFHMSSQSLEKQLSEEVLFSAMTNPYRDSLRIVQGLR